MEHSKISFRSFYQVYVSIFFIPKNILKIPLKNFGLLTKTTFTTIPPKIYLQYPKTAETNSQMARIATRHFAGSIQLAIMPRANVNAHEHLQRKFFLRILLPPTLHYIGKELIVLIKLFFRIPRF